MERIVGAQHGGFTPDCSLDAAPGSTYPWEGSVEGTNTGNGNKLTSQPIVGWKVRGGRLAVGFTLYHNSQGSHNGELGPKWTHSYNLRIVEVSTPCAASYVHWGDDLAYAYTPDISGDLIPPCLTLPRFDGHQVKQEANLFLPNEVLACQNPNCPRKGSSPRSSNATPFG